MEVFITDYDTPDNPAWPEYSPSARAFGVHLSPPGCHRRPENMAGLIAMWAPPNNVNVGL